MSLAVRHPSQAHSVFGKAAAPDANSRKKEIIVSAEVITALIAVGGVIIGGLISAWASAYSTRHKIKELELQYLQEKRNTYLENARVHVNSIYIPLQASITRLVLRFENYRRSTPNDSAELASQKESEFREEMARFIKDTHQLLHSGADAFITTELSEALRSFLSFLQSSFNSTQAREKVLVSYEIGLPGIKLSRSHGNEVASTKIKRILSSSASVNVFGMGFTVERNQVIEAPLISPEFEQRFVDDTILLRGYIKEVTLGSKALP